MHGNYTGIYGNRRPQQEEDKDDPIYANVSHKKKVGFYKVKYQKFGKWTKGSKEGKYSTGLKFVKKETLVNVATRETMVKEPYWKPQKKEDEEEKKRKDKFRRDDGVPKEFGRGGSQAAVDEAAREQVLKKEERKYEKYGKGFKIMKKMGFTADLHKEIVHVFKRKDNLGLGVAKEKHARFAKHPTIHEYSDDEAKDDTKNKDLSKDQPEKPSDRDFLHFIINLNSTNDEMEVDLEGQEEDYQTSFLHNQRVMKELNLIDETGGQADKLFTRQNRNLPKGTSFPIVVSSL
jgi:hypothetical protein